MTRPEHLRALVLTAAALATLAWAATPAQAQLSAEIRLRTVPGFRNVYFVSIPYAESIEDVANGSNQDVCDIEATGPDGFIDIDDVLCTLWGGGVQEERVGLMSVSQFDPANCQFRVRTGRPDPFHPGSNIFLGNPWVPDWRRGFMVQLASGPGQALHDATVTLEAACEPGFPELTIEGRPFCAIDRNFEILSIPYDTTYTQAAEILCGEEGVDWTFDEDGYPDQCHGGLYDGVRTLTVVTYDNDPDSVPESDGRQVALRVLPDPFAGEAQIWPFGIEVSNFDLQPGQAVLLWYHDVYGPEAWDPPRDDTCGGAE